MGDVLKEMFKEKRSYWDEMQSYLDLWIWLGVSLEGHTTPECMVKWYGASVQLPWTSE